VQIPFLEKDFFPYIARYRMANQRWVALNALDTPEMLRYKKNIAEQANAWSQAGYVPAGLAMTWSNIAGLIAQSWYRWTKYPLLVRAIIEHTKEGDPDYERINDLTGTWTVIGALLSGEGIEGAVAARSNTRVKLAKAPLMTRFLKKPGTRLDAHIELEGHRRRLQKLDSGAVDFINNVRAWIDAAAECMHSAISSNMQFADNIHGRREEQWENVSLAMVEGFGTARSKFVGFD
jgi:hypothetical protein